MENLELKQQVSNCLRAFRSSFALIAPMTAKFSIITPMTIVAEMLLLNIRSQFIITFHSQVKKIMFYLGISKSIVEYVIGHFQLFFAIRNILVIIFIGKKIFHGQD